MIDPSAPVAYQPHYELGITSSEGTWTDVFVLGVRRPYIEHYEHAVEIAEASDAEKSDLVDDLQYLVEMYEYLGDAAKAAHAKQRCEAIETRGS